MESIKLEDKFRKNLKLGLLSKIKNKLLSLKLGKSGRSLFIGKNVEFMRNPKKIFLGNNVVINDYCRLCPTNKNALIKIGNWTSLGYNSFIFASSKVEIGDNCLFGAFTYIVDAEHGTKKGMLVREQPLSIKPIKIGNGVWVGTGSKIFQGVTIGDGAIIGNSSVVMQDIPPNCIAIGVPARVVKKRD